MHAHINTYLHTYIQTDRQTDRQTDIQTYRHTDIQTYRQTDIQTYRQTYIQAYRHTYVNTYIHTYIRTYIHTDIHTDRHTDIHTYTFMQTFFHFARHTAAIDMSMLQAPISQTPAAFTPSAAKFAHKHSMNQTYGTIILTTTHIFLFENFSLNSRQMKPTNSRTIKRPGV